MPYIGRNHIAGDHTSNFKVLDDISSYTATFNGSLATIVSTADETIRIPEHRFIQGQRVTYSNGGGSNIGGLTNGTAYYVTFDTHNTIKLATSLVNANNNTNINLTSVGGGASHTLTAAFDGVNQKFKLTHSGGSDVHINNSTQVSIAINNVIQKPNNDAAFTEGFRVVHNEQIEFKVAPTTDNVFWGTVIANTIETFDISDLKIDNFTGDGSTTQYTLSRDVPNNQSIMVTLDGVIQHPSDKDNSRAYALVTDSIIQFTAAPGLGIEIQVRHLGFAGASTGTVSGFYGRTGNVVLGSGDNITVGNINVGTGVTIESNGQATYTGVITATSFSGSGAGLTGIDATSIKDSGGNVKVQAQASGAVYTGIHTFTTLNSTTGTFSGAIDANGDLDVDGHTNLDNVSVAGVATVAGNLHVGGVLTYEDVTNVDSVGLITARNGINVSGGNIKVGTGVTIEPNGQATFTGIVTFGSSSTTIDGDANTIKVGTALTLGHTQGLQFHTQNLHSQGFEINQINASGIITATGADINGDLDVDGHTNLDNVSIAGLTTANQLRLADSKYLQIGNSQDLQLYHDGSHSYVNSYNGTGNLYVSGNSVRVQSNDNRMASLSGTDIIKTDATTAYLYHNGSVRMQTNAVGVTVNRDLDVDGHTNLDNVSIAGVTTFTGALSVNGDAQFTGGASAVSIAGGSDIRLSNGSWTGNSGSTAKIQCHDNKLYIVGGAGGIIFREDGTDRWFIDGNGHFGVNADSTYDIGTNSTRVRNIYADTLYGSGANLTGIEAFVTGMIILWSGAANAIPSGFVLCNGSNGTPDLRGKFVVGYHDGNNDYDVGDTGGSETVTLSTSQIPSHSHTTNNHSHNASVSDPGHGHSVSISDPGHKHNTSVDGAKLFPGNGGAHVPYGGAGGYPGTHFNMSNANTGISANASNANTSISVSIGNQNPTTNTEGGGGAHENRPPFYALCYIMKT